MAEASPPRNGGVRVTLPGVATILWTLIVASVMVATTYVYATKVELSEHAKEESAISADLKTRASVVEQAVGHHDKALDKIERYMEAQTANTETLMRAIEIPKWQIKKAREE